MGKTSKSKPTPAHDAWRDFLLFCANQETSQQVYRGVGSVDYELVSKVGRSASYSGQKEINVFNLFEARSQLYHSIQALSCLLYTSPSPRDRQKSRMPSS